jgi:hypothetical protein
VEKQAGAEISIVSIDRNVCKTSAGGRGSDPALKKNIFFRIAIDMNEKFNYIQGAMGGKN